tara:strand:- start:730 stop:1248 length:519 start_codon:yes stop_codon:yes gene_type:complete
MVEWKFKKSGLPVGNRLNKIIEVIEKTPEDNFMLLSRRDLIEADDYLKSTIDFHKIPNSEKYEYFKKNPQSIFYYRGRNEINSHNVFTNFKVDVDTDTLYYDNIRLWPFQNQKIYNDDVKELMRVKEIARHSGLTFYEGRDWSPWRIIDFLNPELVSKSFINWNELPWSDLK